MIKLTHETDEGTTVTVLACRQHALLVTVRWKMNGFHFKNERVNEGQCSMCPSVSAH